MRDIGKNIRQLRVEKNMTQDDLAEKLFVTRQTVSNYETGKSRPDIDMLVKISEVLETDIHQIIYGPEPKQLNPGLRRLSIAAAITAVLGIAWLVLKPTAEQLARNTYSLGLRVAVGVFLGPACSLAAGWTGAQVLGMALKKKPFSGKWAKRIGLALLAVLAIWALLCLWWYLPTQIPEWLVTLAYRVFVFYYRIQFLYPVTFTFILSGAALWLCGVPPERKKGFPV